MVASGCRAGRRKSSGPIYLPGLTSGEVAARLERYGRNQLQEAAQRSPWAIFLDQFKDFIIWVLIGAAVVSGVLQEVVDAVAIIMIVILNAILGFVQEYRAEKSLAALKRLSSPTSKVIRAVKYAQISSEELVPGDVSSWRRATVCRPTAGWRGSRPTSASRKPA